MHPQHSKQKISLAKSINFNVTDRAKYAEHHTENKSLGLWTNLKTQPSQS